MIFPKCTGKLSFAPAAPSAVPRVARWRSDQLANLLSYVRSRPKLEQLSLLFAGKTFETLPALQRDHAFTPGAQWLSPEAETLRYYMTVAADFFLFDYPQPFYPPQPLDELIIGSFSVETEFLDGEGVRGIAWVARSGRCEFVNALCQLLGRGARASCQP